MNTFPYHPQWGFLMQIENHCHISNYDFQVRCNIRTSPKVPSKVEVSSRSSSSWFSWWSCSSWFLSSWSWSWPTFRSAYLVQGTPPLFSHQALSMASPSQKPFKYSIAMRRWAFCGNTREKTKIGNLQVLLDDVIQYRVHILLDSARWKWHFVFFRSVASTFVTMWSRSKGSFCN